DRPLADHHRLTKTGLHLGLGESLGIGPQVEEIERILRPKIGRLLYERALVRQRRDAGAGAHGEVVSAMWTHPERRLELIVPIMRSALRACVRVLLSRRL